MASLTDMWLIVPFLFYRVELQPLSLQFQGALWCNSFKYMTKSSKIQSKHENSASVIKISGMKSKLLHYDLPLNVQNKNLCLLIIPFIFKIKTRIPLLVFFSDCSCTKIILFVCKNFGDVCRFNWDDVFNRRCCKVIKWHCSIQNNNKVSHKQWFNSKLDETDRRISVVNVIWSEFNTCWGSKEVEDTLTSRTSVLTGFLKCSC